MEQLIKDIINKTIFLNHKLIDDYINIICDCTDLIPAQGTFSIEFQFFPKLINNKLYAYLCLGELIDIGTPESYAKMIKKI